MRGIDYRAPHIGIQLLLCAPLNNQRELLQAAMRVGRQGDPCQRFKLKGLDLIDKNAENLYKRKLNHFIHAHAPTTSFKFAPGIAKVTKGKADTSNKQNKSSKQETELD
jgi:hypothetical protein